MTPEGPEFVIGSLASDHLRVRPLRRTHPHSTDYWDGGWIDTAVAVRAGAFRGSCTACLTSDEFARFLDELEPLYESLAGKAEFTSMEEWLSVEITVEDRLGHLRATCTVRDEPGIGNVLHFDLTLDQTDLPPILKGLRAICAAFPVAGSPGE